MLPREPDSDGEATRRALIASGRRLFAQKGFDGSSVRAITRLADANLGAITYHFGSKRELYTAVLEQGLRPLAERIVQEASGSGTARYRMTRVVRAYFEHFEKHPDLPHLLIQEVAAGKAPPPVVAETLQSVISALARLQAEGNDDGSIRPGHPVLTALSVVAQPVYMTLVAPMLERFGGINLRDAETRVRVVAHAAAFVDAGLRSDAEAAPTPQEAS
jgi:AcrR family transcriptional regulator